MSSSYLVRLDVIQEVKSSQSMRIGLKYIVYRDQYFSGFAEKRLQERCNPCKPIRSVDKTIYVTYSVEYTQSMIPQ